MNCEIATWIAISTQPTGTDRWIQNIDTCSAIAMSPAVRAAKSKPYQATISRKTTTMSRTPSRIA